MEKWCRVPVSFLFPGSALRDAVSLAPERLGRTSLMRYLVPLFLYLPHHDMLKSNFIHCVILIYNKVIGAGVVGLAVARQLAAREGTSTVLLERHDAPGTETSSRNSEVRMSPLAHKFD